MAEHPTPTTSYTDLILDAKLTEWIVYLVIITPLIYLATTLVSRILGIEFLPTLLILVAGFILFAITSAVDDLIQNYVGPARNQPLDDQHNTETTDSEIARELTGLADGLHAQGAITDDEAELIDRAVIHLQEGEK